MTQKQKISGFVSCVMIVNRYDEKLEQRISEADTLFHSQFEDHEIVLICLPLEAAQIESMEAMLRRIRNIRFLMLSSVFSKEILFAAGMEQAIGDFVVMMNFVCDPLAAAAELVHLCRDGNDVVLGAGRNMRMSLGYRVISPLLRKISRHVLKYELPKNFTGMMCISRRAANAVMLTSRFHQTFEARIAYTGYQTSVYEYDIHAPHSRPPKRGRHCFRDGVRQLVLNSTLPLRWASAVGLFGSGCAMLFSLYSIVIKLLKNDVVAGWASQMTVTSFLFILVFFMLGLFGEYLARMLNDINSREQYDVIFEKHSSVMLDANRLNVLEESRTVDVNKVQTGRDR